MQWKLFTIKDEEEIKNYTKEEMLENYFRILKNISLDEEVVKMVWTKEMDDYFWNMAQDTRARKEGYQKGMEAGLKKGLKKELKKQKDIIMKMHQENLSFETISKCMDLSIDEIKEIIKNNG